MEQVAWILALVLAFIIAPLLIWSRRERRARRGIPSDPHTLETNTGQDLVPTPASTERSSSGGSRRMRRRPISAVASSSSSSTSSLAAVSELEIYDDGDEGSNDAVESTYFRPKQSKKKNERKHEKEMRREAETAGQDMRKEKEERLAQLHRRRDDEREAEERKKEEEAERQKLKEEAAAATEFDKWKSAFSVETEGVQEDVQEYGQGLLNNFVDYIKKHKCVALEDLAAEFNIRTQDCINRVMALEQLGRISGVMDERGKFIYISLDEMKAVADYIKRLGRVSISHLASRSNEFIDLEAKTLTSDYTQEADIPAELRLPGLETSVGQWHRGELPKGIRNDW